jgi:L-lysine 2,3-aminomutase
VVLAVYETPRNVNSHHVRTYISTPSDFIAQREKTEAAGFMRLLRRFEDQVQQRTSDMCEMLCQRFAMRLRCFEEAREAGTNEKETFGWNTIR